MKFEIKVNDNLCKVIEKHHRDFAVELDGNAKNAATMQIVIEEILSRRLPQEVSNDLSARKFNPFVQVRRLH